MNTKEKEKLIEIEEHNVKDSVDSLKNQEVKNLGLLAFIGGILPFLFDSLSQTPICVKIIILIFSFISFALLVWNILSKRVDAQSNVENFFIQDSSYENFQISYHLSLIRIKNNIDKLTETKVLIFKIAITIFSVNLFTILIFNLFFT